MSEKNRTCQLLRDGDWCCRPATHTGKDAFTQGTIYICEECAKKRQSLVFHYGRVILPIEKGAREARIRKIREHDEKVRMSLAAKDCRLPSNFNDGEW